MRGQYSGVAIGRLASDDAMEEPRGWNANASRKRPQVRLRRLPSLLNRRARCQTTPATVYQYLYEAKKRSDVNRPMAKAAATKSA